MSWPRRCARLLLAVGGSQAVGKTTLALYVRAKIRDQFPDGQLWVELAATVGL